MKTRIIMLLLIGASLATSAFASPKNEVNRNVISSFSEQFTAASHVSWSNTKGYLKASFQLDGQFLFAYYLPSGELIGVSRHISTTRLPLKLQSELKKDFGNNWVSELFEFPKEDETIYVATVENGEEKMILKSSDGVSWSIAQKVKKA